MTMIKLCLFNSNLSTYPCRPCLRRTNNRKQRKGEHTVWPVPLILLHLSELCPARSEERPGPAAGRALLRQMEEFVMFTGLVLLPRAGLTQTGWRDKGGSRARARSLPQPPVSCSRRWARTPLGCSPSWSPQGLAHQGSQKASSSSKEKAKSCARCELMCFQGLFTSSNTFYLISAQSTPANIMLKYPEETKIIM